MTAHTRTALKPLRPHQDDALYGIKVSLSSGKRRPVLQAACGFGKTIVACHIVAGALAKAKRVAFCVPALSLIDQTFERFAENGIDPVEMGVVQGNHPWTRPHAPVQICSAMTLARRDLPDVDVVVIDECHIRFKAYDDWMSKPEWRDKPFIGLTATPWAKGMGKHYDDLIKPITMQQLIDLGFLSPFRVFAPSHPDLKGIKTIAGDYHEGQLAERMNQPQLVADIVSTWLEKGEGRPTICFAVNCLHAQNIRDQFEDAGVPAAYIDADTPRDERGEIGRALAAGSVKVVVSVGCLIAGIDWDVRCIIFARPTKSEMLFVQAIGRGLRTAPGKDHCVILDHSDTTLRLGFVTDIDQAHTMLDDGSDKKGKAAAKDKEDRLPLPKECGNCTGLIPPGAPECPCCGHVAKRKSDVLTAAGELTEMTSSTKRKQGKSENSADVLRAMPPEMVWSEIKGLQAERGRADGWAAHLFKSLFEMWPPRAWNNVNPHPAGYALRAYEHSRRIAYAKATEAQRKMEAAHAGR